MSIIRDGFSKYPPPSLPSTPALDKTQDAQLIPGTTEGEQGDANGEIQTDGTSTQPAYVSNVNGFVDNPHYDSEQVYTFPGTGSSSAASGTPEIQLVSTLNSSDDDFEVLELGELNETNELDEPDLPANLSDLTMAVEYHRAALDAFNTGHPQMAQDLFNWARELDPGAPQIKGLA